MFLLSSGVSFLIGGLVLLLLGITLRQGKSVKSYSALLILLGGFNGFTDKEGAASSAVLIGAAILLIVLFAIAYESFCVSILEPFGFPSKWQVMIGAYLPAFYISLLAIFLVWLIQSEIEKRGLALYVSLVFVLSIHMVLFVSTITRPERLVKSSGVVPAAQPLVPTWFWTALGLVMLIAIVVESLGRKDWVLLSLNLFTTGLFAVPFIASRFKWQSG